MRWSVVAVMALSACSLPLSGIAGQDSGAGSLDAGPSLDAGDAGVPFDAGPFDAGAPFDAGPRPDSGGRCTAADDGCVADVETVCDTSTGLLETRPCALGCSPGAPRCARLVPSNVSPSLLPFSAADVSITSNIDTTDCSGSGLSVETQSGGVSICVLRAGQVRVPSGATVEVTGSRPLVVLAAGAVFIDGTLDASAFGTRPGAGGSAGGTRTSPDGAGPFRGARGGTSGAYDDGGGGGGGFCGSGGAGGDGNSAGGGSGGGRVGPGEQLRPLVGGSGGGWARGASGAGFDNSADGGAGGGAIQITSRVAIAIEGAVLAGGGGGRGGERISDFDTNFGGGGGGGSGGAILLEAPTVTSPGRLIATGGAGGGSAGCEGGACPAPATISEAYGDPGEDGRGALDRASGGARGGSRYGAGGGDSGGGDASDGLDGQSRSTEVGDNGGGGGGGAGCIVVRTADGAGLPGGLANVSSRNSRAFNALIVDVD